MILPSKHIRLARSLLNLGAILLNNMDEAHTMTMLWDRTKDRVEIRTFERFTLCLDLLFALNLVEFQDGLIMRIGK